MYTIVRKGEGIYIEGSEGILSPIQEVKLKEEMNRKGYDFEIFLPKNKRKGKLIIKEVGTWQHTREKQYR